jgi:hypothetical protein
MMTMMGTRMLMVTALLAAGAGVATVVGQPESALVQNVTHACRASERCWSEIVLSFPIAE